MQKPPNGSDWSYRRKLREEGVWISLPSGERARVRAVGFDLIISLGRMPDVLTAFVMDSFEKGVGVADWQPTKPEELKALVDLANAMCQAAFVEPRIVDNPQVEDEITIHELTMDDKFFVMAVVNRPARELERFSIEQARNVEPVLPGETDQPAAEPVDEDSGVGEAAVPDGRVVDGASI